MSALLDPDADPAECDVLLSLSSLTVDDSRSSPNSCHDDISKVTIVDNEPTSNLPSIIDEAGVHAYTIPNEAFFRALSFLLQYEQSRDNVHLEGAIKEYRSLLEITPFGHPDYVSFQSFLCDALCEKFDLWGDLAVIEEAVELGDAVMSASCDSHPDYLHHLCCSARSLTFRYEATTQESDVTRAVALVEVAKTGIEDERADKACILMAHGSACFSYFEARSELQFLQHAIATFRSALCMLREASSDRAACLAFLIKCHNRSYDLQLSDVTDWTELALYAQSAVNLTSSEDLRLPWRLIFHASVLQQKGEATADPQSLDESISLSRSAVRCLVPGVRSSVACFAGLGNGLFRRYGLLGSIEDLNESIRVYEKGLVTLGKQERNYRATLGNYCSMLRERYKVTGRLQDLDTSIYELQQMMAERSPAQSMHQNSRRTLGALICERYYLLRRPEDLHRAVQILAKNAADQPTNVLDLQKAGVIYHRLYELTRELPHLHAAIKYFSLAEPRSSWRVYTVSQYASFGAALVSRAQLSVYPADWERAVQRLRLAEQEARPGHCQRPEVLRMLATALRQRFERFISTQDIRESISILSNFLGKAVSYERARFSSALGESMASYFNLSREATYLHAALEHFQSAARDEEGFISERFHAALKWATLAKNNARPSSAHNGYRLGVQLLPRVSWVGFGKRVRLEELQKQAATLAVDAAASAIENHEYESAVELLESGRGVLWSQLLQLRTDFDSIQDVAPSVATELHDVSRALEMDVAGSGGLEGERLLQRQRRLAERWEQLLEEVRKIDGFQTFLTSPQFSDLLPSAEAGPVVIFNASESRCDAIIISPKVRAYHCPLPLMRMDYALLLSRFLRQALMVPKDSQGTTFLDCAVLNVLDRLWTTVGAPVWEALRKLYSDGMPRRVWFCPTGPFCLLPLHAAKPTDGPGFPDLFICSYTVTLSSLIRARADRQHAGQVVQAPNLLAVSQPATPGYDPLDCAVEEMRVIYETSLGETTTFLNGADATVASVCEEMLENAWVHFSCHGSSNAVNPLETCLRFHDGPLNLSRISELRLPHADFAFLSACHTARAFGNLPDEALHLAAGLQLAGFKSVIGTQWSIADIDAPDVAKIVYEYMTQEGRYDHRSAAEGLHKAVNELRSRGVASWRWVPFIHLGV